MLFKFSAFSFYNFTQFSITKQYRLETNPKNSFTFPDMDLIILRTFLFSLFLLYFINKKFKGLNIFPLTFIPLVFNLRA
jgi:hypothetical protein